jgi:hypothetical protein
MILGGLVLGVLLARVSQPAPLLHVPSNQQVTVERQETVRDQYFHAISIGSEEAWLSIAKYFPPSESEENQYYACGAPNGWRNCTRRQAISTGRWSATANWLRPSSMIPISGQRAMGLAGWRMCTWHKANCRRRGSNCPRWFNCCPNCHATVQQMLIDEVNTKLRTELRQLIRDFEPRNGARLDSP